MTLSEDARQLYLDRALKAADWFVNTQLEPEFSCDANAGRFLYYYYMPDRKWIPGINWSHGRAIFVLTDAYNITGDRRYLDSAELGARYIRALQPLDPYYEVTYGSIVERFPHENWGGTLDGAQAASAMLMLNKVTGERDYLRHGKAFCDFLLRTWRNDVGFPRHVTYHPEQVFYPGDPIWSIGYATAIPLWHAHNITGEGQYIDLIAKSADFILESQREDGGINCLPEIDSIEELPPNHHWGLGEGIDQYLLLNDDGIVTVVLAACKATGDEKYLDAMVRYADWTIANEPHERPFNAFGIQAANVLDIGSISGKDYTPWVLEHLQERCLDLQVLDSGDPMADGGFRGEDEEGDGGIFGGTSLDYVVTRTTCYMAGVLFRLSGKGTGTGFSVHGIGDVMSRINHDPEDNNAPIRDGGKVL